MIEKKLNKLKKILLKMENLLIAYSGGVDSTFLLKVSLDTLGRENVFAITAKSETYPDEEINFAKKLTKKMGVKHLIIKTNELENKNFYKNPFNRCYYCKEELFSKLRETAKKYNLKNIADGSNLDDLSDYRPGEKAAKKYKIRHPLREAKLKKKEIRILSKKLNLPTWNKPNLACLASRIPYGEEINKNKLKKIAQAEKEIKKMGMKQVRVRMHKNIARIEINKGDFSKIIDKKIYFKIVSKFKKLGFNFVCLDLEGYRTGSMNTLLGREK